MELHGAGVGRGFIKAPEPRSSPSINVSISFPEEFLMPTVSIDEVPLVKLWSARFFLKQLLTVWKIEVPVQFPNRLVLVSLLDAIIGEVYSSADALEKKLKRKIRSKKLKRSEHKLLTSLDRAKHNDNWLGRVIKLRNEGLHGSYLAEEIRIGGSPPLDLRLVRYKNGIVADVSLPEDLELVCGKLEELIKESTQLVEKACQERNAT